MAEEALRNIERHAMASRADGHAEHEK